MDSVRSKNLSLKYQGFTLTGCKEIKGIIKFEFVIKILLFNYILFSFVNAVEQTKKETIIFKTIVF